MQTEKDSNFFQLKMTTYVPFVAVGIIVIIMWKYSATDNWLIVANNSFICAGIIACAILFRKQRLVPWVLRCLSYYIFAYALVLIFVVEYAQGAVMWLPVGAPLAFLCFKPKEALIYSVVILCVTYIALLASNVVDASLFSQKFRFLFIVGYALVTCVSGLTAWVSQLHREKLASARSRIERLEEILSMCMYCRKVKMDGEWFQVEKYLAENKQTAVSHGICTECFDTRLKDMELES